MYAFLVSPRQTFLKTTEQSGINTILSRGSRRKLFNSSLMNKLIRIEWMSEWVSAIRLPSNLMDVTHPWEKTFFTLPLIVLPGRFFFPQYKQVEKIYFMRKHVSGVFIGAVSWESRESREYFSHGIDKLTWSNVGLAAMCAAESFS